MNVWRHSACPCQPRHDRELRPKARGQALPHGAAARPRHAAWHSRADIRQPLIGGRGICALRARELCNGLPAAAAHTRRASWPHAASPPKIPHGGPWPRICGVGHGKGALVKENYCAPSVGGAWAPTCGRNWGVSVLFWLALDERREYRGRFLQSRTLLT